MHFVREILLRNVKYALRRVDLFYFTESDSFLFHNFDRNYFTSSEARYFTKNMHHLNHSALPKIDKIQKSLVDFWKVIGNSE